MDRAEWGALVSTLRGVLIARTRSAAHDGLQQMAGLLGYGPEDRIPSLWDWVVLGPRATSGVRGLVLPNRVLLVDLDPTEVSRETWEAIFPTLRRDDGARVNVYRWGRSRDPLPALRTDEHVFTVRRQDGIGPHPPELPCSRCGRRADQHVTVAVAQG